MCNFYDIVLTVIDSLATCIVSCLVKMNTTSLQSLLDALSGFALEAPAEAMDEVSPVIVSTAYTNSSPVVNHSESRPEVTSITHFSRLHFSPLTIFIMMVSCIMALVVCTLYTLVRLGAARLRGHRGRQPLPEAELDSSSTSVSIGSSSRARASRPASTNSRDDHTYALSVERSRDRVDPVVPAQEGGERVESVTSQISEPSVESPPVVPTMPRNEDEVLYQLDDYMSAFLPHQDFEYDIYFDPDLLAVRGRRVWRNHFSSQHTLSRGPRRGGRGGRRGRRYR